LGVARNTIAIDIDGTLRDLERQLRVFIEVDHPDKAEQYMKGSGVVYRTLDAVFENKDAMYKWMYEERVFELFGQAPRLHPKVIDDLNIFTVAARKQGFDVVIASVQRDRSVTSTLHWLSKWGCRVPRYEFFNTMQDKIDRNFDFYVDDCPDVIQAYVGKKKTPSWVQSIEGYSRIIKIPYEFTKDFDCPSLDIASGKFDDLYEMLGIERLLKK
jgi:hypothetical protein